MALTIPKAGKLELLDSLMSDGMPVTLRLYKALAAPIGPDLLLVQITQADFSGYAPVPIDSWQVAILNGAGKAETEADPAEFAHDGGPVANTVKGYYATHTGTGNLLWIEADPNGDTVLANEGDKIIVTPRFTAESEL